MKRGFIPSTYTYKFIGKYSAFKPKFTSIMYYVRENDGSYSAVCKFNVSLFFVLSILLLLFTTYIMFQKHDYEVIVKCPKTMYIHDNVISLDLQNDSEFSVLADLYVDDELILSSTINANSSKSNIQCTSSLAAGNYSAKLNISHGDIVRSQNLLIVVE